ncbi:MAG: hypothetical protein HQ593_05150 [Candidatus Omnitrophica bacterium]|nr:hypothetical protein [Candidatus Omnitrophota bacterium]
MITCPICKKKIRKITGTHLSYKHRLNTVEFIKRYPNIDRGMIPWNKGETKFSHPGVLKISKTMTAKSMSNFTNWHKLRRKSLNYAIKKSENLAELIGVILGDGSIEKYPRTQRLWITCDLRNDRYIQHLVNIIKEIFNKRPSLRKKKSQRGYAIDIYLYRCKLSAKLGIHAGNKIKNNVGVPVWIKKNKKFIIKCLKGLFETDGCFHEDKLNYTRTIEFTNFCSHLREDVHSMLKQLGYHPQLGKRYVRLARNKEVYDFKRLINFRNY